MKKSSPTSIAGDTEWQAQSDVRTLVEAEQIKRDPKRLAAAKACAKKRLEETAAVVATQSTSAQ